MKTYSTSEIIKMYPSVQTPAPVEKYFSVLQIAKSQHGTRLEKVEMVMSYMKFKTIIEEDNCFNYLMLNL